LFRVHNSYRYIETSFNGDQLDYLLSELNWSPYLEKVIAAAADGISVPALITMLMEEEEVEKEDAEEYVQELVNSQVMVSEFSIHITMDDNLAYFIERLSAMNEGTAVLNFLHEVKNGLALIDAAPLGKKTAYYASLNELVRKTLNRSNTDIVLLQSNLYVEPLQATIGKDIVALAKDALRIMNILTPSSKDPVLSDFKRKFYERYELEEVPLTEAVDPDIGVSRGNFAPAGLGSNMLISGISAGAGTASGSIPAGIVIHRILYAKYCEYLATGASEIRISEDDLKGFHANWDDLPVTLSVGVDILQPGNRILIKYAGGYSAVNTLARFSSNNATFLTTAKQITAFEDSYYGEDVIVADIAYMAEDLGLGNTMKRPPLRKYEIPLLSFTSGNEVATIGIEDIMISVNEEQTIKLRSKSLNKYIIPRNTNAHNFTHKTSPLYYFLCSYQGEGNLRGSLLFDWGALVPQNGYYPRVTYKDNIILSAARWLIQPTEIKPEKDFNQQLRNIILDRKIPSRVYLTANFDTRLVLDLTCEDTLDLLKTELGKGAVLLEECMLDESNAFINNEGKCYSHEIVLNFYKTTVNEPAKKVHTGR
jgi:hypothetical protein